MAKFNYTAQRGLLLLGDEVGAWMADITAETLVGVELVTNGDMSSMTGWTLLPGTGGGSITSTSSQMLFTQGATSKWMHAYQAINVMTGETYIISISNISVSYGYTQFAVGVNTPAIDTGYTGDIETLSTVVGSVMQITFTATFTGTVNIVISDGQIATETSVFDNASGRLAVPDLSTANNGLGVHGSITKAAVATGADLVGYSGFSASNYLEQPYNADLDFGTGDFCFMGWLQITPNTSSEDILSRAYYSGGWIGSGILLRVLADGSLKPQITDDGFITVDSITGPIIDDNTSKFITFLRNGSSIYLYVDDVLYASSSIINASSSLSNTSATLQFGRNQSTSEAPLIDGELSMWRVFNYAPTAAQIKSIYDSEKHLFETYSTYTQEGQQYTLDIPLQVADRTRKAIKNESVTLSGRRQSVVHRNEYDWNITTGFIHRTDPTDYPKLSEIDEFIYSTQGSETFTVDIYDENNYKSMVMVTSQVADARQETSDIFTASFKMQESNQ